MVYTTWFADFVIWTSKPASSSSKPKCSKSGLIHDHSLDPITDSLIDRFFWVLTSLETLHRMFGWGEGGSWDTERMDSFSVSIMLFSCMCPRGVCKTSMRFSAVCMCVNVCFLDHFSYDSGIGKYISHYFGLDWNSCDPLTYPVVPPWG